MVNNGTSHADPQTEPAGDPPARREGHSRTLPAAAMRALAEAEARRAAAAAASVNTPEIGGRGGDDPVRYGDWEVRGLASDF